MGVTALGLCGGPEMNVKGLRLVRRAPGGCGGPEMDLKGFRWVWST